VLLLYIMQISGGCMIHTLG